MSKTRSAKRPQNATADEVYDAGLDYLESYSMQTTKFKDVQEAIHAGMSSILSAAEMYRAEDRIEDENATYKILAEKYESLGDEFVDHARELENASVAKGYLDAADNYYHEAIMIATQFSHYRDDISNILELHFSRLHILELKATLDPANDAVYVAAIESYIQESGLESLIDRKVEEVNEYKEMLQDYQGLILLRSMSPLSQTGAAAEEKTEVNRRQTRASQRSIFKPPSDNLDKLDEPASNPSKRAKRS